MKFDLEGATTQALLAHAVSFDGGDDVLGVEMCRRALLQIELLVELIERAPPGVPVEAGALGPVFEDVARRIAVGLELVERQADHTTRRPAAPTQVDAARLS